MTDRLGRTRSPRRRAGPAVLAVAALLVAGGRPAARRPRRPAPATPGCAATLYAIVAAGDRPRRRAPAGRGRVAALPRRSSRPVSCWPASSPSSPSPASTSRPSRTTASGLRLDGRRALPAWLWSTDDRRRHRRPADGAGARPARPRPSTGAGLRQRYPLAVAAVVASGLLVRVTDLARRSPRRRPTAATRSSTTSPPTLLAAGRGFLEPHNWLELRDATSPAPCTARCTRWSSRSSSRLGGTTYVDHKFLSILIGTATVLVTVLLAGRLAGPRAAIVAGVLAAVYPNLWLIDSLLFPEGLFALLTTPVHPRRLPVWRDRPGWGRAAVLGALIGLAGLTRGEGLLLGLLLAVPWILVRRAAGPRPRAAPAAGVGCGVPGRAGAVDDPQPHDVRRVRPDLDEQQRADHVRQLRRHLLGSPARVLELRLPGALPGRASASRRATRRTKALFWRQVGVDYARDHAGEVPQGGGRPRAAAVGAVPAVADDRVRRRSRTATRSASTVGLGMYYALVAASIAGARRAPSAPRPAAAPARPGRQRHRSPRPTPTARSASAPRWSRCCASWPRRAVALAVAAAGLVEPAPVAEPAEAT